MTDLASKASSHHSRRRICCALATHYFRQKRGSQLLGSGQTAAADLPPMGATAAQSGGSGAPKHARQSGAVAPRIVRLYFENSLPGHHVREPPVAPAGRDVSFGNPIQLPGEFIAQPGLLHAAPLLMRGQEAKGVRVAFARVTRRVAVDGPAASDLEYHARPRCQPHRPLRTSSALSFPSCPPWRDTTREHRQPDRACVRLGPERSQFWSRLRSYTRVDGRLRGRVSSADGPLCTLVDGGPYP